MDPRRWCVWHAITPRTNPAARIPAVLWESVQPCVQSRVSGARCAASLTPDQTRVLAAVSAVVPAAAAAAAAFSLRFAWRQCDSASSTVVAVDTPSPHTMYGVRPSTFRAAVFQAASGEIPNARQQAPCSISVSNSTSPSSATKSLLMPAGVRSRGSFDGLDRVGQSRSRLNSFSSSLHSLRSQSSMSTGRIDFVHTQSCPSAATTATRRSRPWSAGVHACSSVALLPVALLQLMLILTRAAVVGKQWNCRIRCHCFNCRRKRTSGSDEVNERVGERD